VVRSGEGNTPLSLHISVTYSKYSSLKNTSLKKPALLIIIMSWKLFWLASTTPNLWANYPA